MARPGGEAMAKRNRERARQEKQEAKREKQISRQAEAANEPEVDEAALMEEYARLSEQYEANLISESVYSEERRRIFDELGLQVD